MIGAAGKTVALTLARVGTAAPPSYDIAVEAGALPETTTRSSSSSVGAGSDAQSAGGASGLRVSCVLTKRSTGGLGITFMHTDGIGEEVVRDATSFLPRSG